MQYHTLTRTHKNKKARQVGRGGTRGKTAGRGTKGQNARAGHKKRPEIRDFIKRIPKLRGRGKNINTSIQTKAVAISLKMINVAYKAGETVSPSTLISKGLTTLTKGQNATIKILATGTVDKKLTFKDCLMSATARVIVEKAGGVIA